MNLQDWEELNELAIEELESVDKFQDSKNHFDKEIYDDAFRGHIKIGRMYREKIRETEQNMQVLKVKS